MLGHGARRRWRHGQQENERVFPARLFAVIV